MTRPFRTFAATLLLTACALVAACAGTRQAYQAADTLDDSAKVVTEHYFAIIREVNDLADQGAPQEWVTRAQDLERRTSPVVFALRDASEAYEAVRSAENEQALADALEQAVPLVSDFIDLLRERR